MKISLSADSGFQASHFAIGYGFIITLVAVFKIPLWLSWHIGVALAGAKEFVVDPLIETPETSGGWQGDLKDFLFFILGGGIATILCRIYT